ncbi:hypothetical protein MD176_003074 [Salmonella enterica]|nr:hypothetical protein [Salmonella enterica]ECJ2260788.1 hypothetical protein [Salmonella enterica subsp. diarizonae]EDU1693013.1 hypothetical protein [Salmonella enterica subsp. diarizonae serovar 50:k:z]EBC3595020.1 hypothetical protein [Salmonella enterica]EBC3598796.1 hypothetical protein [Salmonella enterica]
MFQQKRFLLQYGKRVALNERSGVTVFVCQHVRRDFAAVIVAEMFTHPHAVAFLRDPVKRAFRKFCQWRDVHVKLVQRQPGGFILFVGLSRVRWIIQNPLPFTSN